jgi:predicted transcriptional regulator
MKKKDFYIKVVMNHLAKEGASTAANIQKETKIRGNIYTLLARMVAAGHISKSDKLYDISSEHEMKDNRLRLKDVLANSNQPRNNALIATFIKEIDFVNDGIRNLEMTRSYLLRRVEQLRAEQ